MLFNSLSFLFLFLPLTVGGFFLLARTLPGRAALFWLVGASLVFYAWWEPRYLAVILLSIAVNFAVGRGLVRLQQQGRSCRALLAKGVTFNLLLLGYFKYLGFGVAQGAVLLGIQDPPLLEMVLPLGISFFTFQQIAYLVDSAKGLVRECDFPRYCLFVTFFPQLIAGPIVHHGEMMPQFADPGTRKVDWGNVQAGLLLLGIGLCKKVALADTFAVWVNQGYADTQALHCLTAWRTSLCYSLQLYCDFSGYVDLALGAALLLNIRLPDNFDSPYKALDIREFWQRWHITLGRFLRNYVYIPLGGNRGGTARTCGNLLATFIIGGIWHGAGWTFLVWGALHGLAAVLHRLWQGCGLRLPRPLAWLTTVLFINATWVYFRAPTLEDAHRVLGAMVRLTGAELPLLEAYCTGAWRFLTPWWLPPLLALALSELFLRNSREWVQRLRPSWPWPLAAAALFCTGVLLLMERNRYTEFIYFQF